MLGNEIESDTKLTASLDTSISAEEELQAVRAQAALDRADNDLRIEPSLDLSDMDALLSSAFASQGKTDSEVSSEEMTDDALLDAALFDEELDLGTDLEPKADAETEKASLNPADASQDSLMDQLGESFGEAPSQNPAGDSLSQSPTNNADDINAAFAAAQRQQGSDTSEGIARAQAPGMLGDQQAQRQEVGLIQGMSMLGGAGLASLAQMFRAGGNSINTSINTRKYTKLTGEMDSHIQNMDGILSRLDANGFKAGIKGLKGDHKTEFVKEFMANPANRQMFDDLLQSIGTLSTKTNQAALAGVAAGLSGDHLEGEIANKLKGVSDKHKEMLDSLHDHNGNTLSQRLDKLIDQVADFLKSMFSKVAETFGYNSSPRM